MRNTPIDPQIINEKLQECGLTEVGKASIREIVKLVNLVEKASGQKFIRMEMGVPGIAPARIGVEAEIESLKSGVAAVYPDIEGIPALKHEASRFVKNFINVDIPAECCVPTVGSLQASAAAFLVANRIDKKKTKTLFIDPGFPVHKQQSRLLGFEFEAFDVYNYRGEKLRAKLESYFSKGDIATFLYSNPNNPSWICFTEQELQIIGELSTKYGVVVLEDLAYVDMDFRKKSGKPGQPPFQATVAHYTSNFILMFSSSKVFSYAGQRLGIALISPALFHSNFPDLQRFYPWPAFGHAYIFGALYGLTAGTSHSAQVAVAAIMKASNDGKYSFMDDILEYGKRAHTMKELFTQYGFKIVYDTDIDQPVADGFYFTISYPGLSGKQLLGELLYYGISAVTLDITGSERTEGLRACVSQFSDKLKPLLNERLKLFQEHHPVE